MKIFRSIEFEVLSSDDFIIGDQIQVDKYTATCQKVTKKGALFLLDQYLDDPYPMGSDNKGGYELSELRGIINSKEVLDIFTAIHNKMVPFKNGDLIRIPYAEEMFGESNAVEASGKKQWELMKNRKNRIAICEGWAYDWEWLQNKIKSSKKDFAVMGNYGSLVFANASDFLGVRPVFRLKFNDYIRL